MVKQILTSQTATAYSEAVDIQNLRCITLQFIAALVSSGNGVFTVEVSNDGTNWVALNMLIDNVTNTNAQNLTRVSSKTLSSNTSVVVSLDDLSWKTLRVKVTVTTDGSYSAWISGNKIALR